MRHLSLVGVVVAALIWACGGSPRTQRRAPDAAAPPAPVPAALLTGPDAQGRLAVFQIAPGEAAPRPLLVPDLGDQRLRSVLPASGGSAMILLLERPDRRRVLVQATLGGASRLRWYEGVPPDVDRIRAVSVDGTVVVAQGSGDRLVVLRLGPDGTHDVQVLGDLGHIVYGLALSSRGTHLAYAVLDPACAGGGSPRLATCPVSLRGLDLRNAGAAPRVLAAPAGAAAYDPQFLDPDGERLLYMTNAADRSDPCVRHFNHCTYALREVAFAGGAGRTVVPDGALARPGPAGGLSYRRLGPGPNRFERQTLVLTAPGREPVTMLPNGVANRSHFLSPDGRFVLAEAHAGADPVPVILSAEGRTLWQGRPHPEVRAVGWLRYALPIQDGTLRPSSEHRRWQAARARAERDLGSGVQVGALEEGPGELGPFERRPRPEDLLEWLGGGGRRAVLVSRVRYCEGRGRAAPRSPHRRFLGSRDDLVLLLSAPDPARASAPGGGVLASFAAVAPDRGRAELLGLDLPDRARAGAWLDLTLRWRIAEAFDRPYQVFIHLDGEQSRIPGDHALSTCGPVGLPAGERFEDRLALELTTRSAEARPGAYRLHLGLYLGPRRARVEGAASVLDGRLAAGTIRIDE